MKQIPRILSIVILLVIYAFTIPFNISDEERSDLAKDFSFEKSVLYYPSNLEPKFVRDVHPQYEKFSTWMSSVGAAVAVTDFDGDNLPNDLVHVDPRFDKIFISPAEGNYDRFQPFELKVSQLPYDKTMAPTGVLANDFNADGKIDILAFYMGRSPVIFYQEQDGFSEAELVEGEKWNSATGTIADFDGDGYPDILIGNYFPDESKLYDPEATDNDQIMQHSFSRGDNGGLNRIFLWSGIENGKAVFKEDKNWLEGCHIPYDWTLAVAAGDINGDLLPEIYVANDFGPDKLLLNQSTPGKLAFTELVGEKKFTTTRSNVIGKDSFKGMGVDFNDINQDGLLDIYVSNIADDYALHESHFVFVHTGDFSALEKNIAPYENKSEALGLSRSSWGWDSKLADFNNDGVMEAVQATGFVKGTVNRWPQLQELATVNDELLTSPALWPKLQPGDDISGDSHIPFFVRHKSGKYFNLSANLDLDEAQITRGIAIADLEHDGRLDFISADQWEDSKVYKNTGTSNNAYLGLTLKYPLEAGMTKDVAIDYTMVGRYAVGAFARIKMEDGTQRVAFVDGGNGHAGRNSSEIHFGLGDIDPAKAVEVELSWRNADGQVNQEVLALKPGWHTILLPL